ncbi:hypothetical protein COBT_001576, partial [Conglomerata obtusa]
MRKENKEQNKDMKKSARKEEDKHLQDEKDARNRQSINKDENKSDEYYNPENNKNIVSCTTSVTKNYPEENNNNTNSNNESKMLTNTETTSEDNNFINYNRIENMKLLIIEIRGVMAKETNKDDTFSCPCAIKVPLQNLTDIFKHYGILLSCMKNHIKVILFSERLFLQIFIFELNILGFFNEKPITIPDVLVGNKEKNFYEQDKYVCSYKTFLNDGNIHINCEQEIDSLCYKYFKLFSKGREGRSHLYIDLLLFLLLKRKESERFFVVFKNYSKTTFGYRFALLLSLQSGCCREGNEIYREMSNNTSAKQEGFIFDFKKRINTEEKMDKVKTLKSISENNLNEKYIAKKDIDTFSVKSAIDNFAFEFLNNLLNDESVFKNFEELFELENNKYKTENIINESKNNKINDKSCLFLFRVIDYIYEIIELKKEAIVWFEEKNIKQTWENNVREWALSRNSDNIKIEYSMIKNCMQYKKYEEGYLIYSLLENKDDECLLKTSVLCLCALKNTGDRIWIERICDLLQACAIRNKNKTCCAVTNNILDQIKSVEDDGREILLINFLRILEKFHLEENEEITNCLLKGFCTLCMECKDTKTCDICYKYTLKIYKKWKNTHEGFFFFKSKSKLSDSIYSHVLGVCDENNDCGSFHDICKDILESRNEIGSSILYRLEKYHRKCNCGRFNRC